MSSTGEALEPARKPGREERILEATQRVIAEHGIAGLSVRAVAKEAGVSVGLMHYYYGDKHELVTAVLHHFEEEDARLVRADPDRDGETHLRAHLRRVASKEFLNTDYLALRLQLWALASTHPDFGEINVKAQKRYRQGLSSLIRDARPELTLAEANKRAAEINIVQNGIWLSALLGVGKPALKRSVERCEEIAFG